MSATQTTMDHHLGALNTTFTGLHIANGETTSSSAPLEVSPTDITQHSRNSSRASTASSISRHYTQTNDRPRSRNDTRLSRASSRGRLPDAADPEYSYVFVPTHNSTSNPNKPEAERNSMRS